MPDAYGTFGSNDDRTNLHSLSAGSIRSKVPLFLVAVVTIVASVVAVLATRAPSCSFQDWTACALRSTRAKSVAHEELIRSSQHHNTEQESFHISLWLVPPPDVEQEQQQVIDELAFGGIIFPPHITVIGFVPCPSMEFFNQKVLPSLQTSLATDNNIPCHLRHEPAFGHVVFQAAALLLEEPDTGEPSDAFTELVQRSRRILSELKLLPPIEEDSPISYPGPLGEPHMSLYYGTEEVPTQQNILDVIPNDCFSFNATRVEIWITDPASAQGVLQWQELAVIDLV